MIINLIAQGNCPRLGQVSCTSCAGLSPGLLQALLELQLLQPSLLSANTCRGNKKAILLVLKDQKFLNPTQVISHISKNRQPCGLSPPCFLLDLCMPVGMQLRWVHRRADQNNVIGLQSLILQEERDMHLHCRWASSGGRSGPGQAVTLHVCVRMCAWVCVCLYWAQGFIITRRAWAHCAYLTRPWSGMGGTASPAISWPLETALSLSVCFLVCPKASCIGMFSSGCT